MHNFFLWGGGGVPGGTENLWGARAPPPVPHSYSPDESTCNVTWTWLEYSLQAVHKWESIRFGFTLTITLDDHLNDHPQNIWFRHPLYSRLHLHWINTNIYLFVFLYRLSLCKLNAANWERLRRNVAHEESFLCLASKHWVYGGWDLKARSIRQWAKTCSNQR